MPKIKVNDVQINHEIYGEGFPLIMILGLESNIDWWGKSLLGKISNHFRVVVFDNRGTGKTEAPDRDFTIETLIDDAFGLMNALKINSAHIFGHSMGGRIAQGLSLKHPSMVKKLVLCSASCGRSKDVQISTEVLEILLTPRKDLSPEKIAKNMLSIFYTTEFLTNHPKIVEIAIKNMTKVQTSNKSYNRQLKAIGDFDVCDRLKTIRTPTCVMHGRKDRLVPFQNGEIITTLIPNTQFIVFENSAHVPFVEERDKFLKSLITFLEEPF